MDFSHAGFFCVSQISFITEKIIMSKKKENDKQESEPSSSRSYLLLKTGVCKKLSSRAEGEIQYQILSDMARQNLFFQIMKNIGGGYVSNEMVSLQSIETCLKCRKKDEPFPSKILGGAFVGRSANNAGFLSAILRAEWLFSVAPGTETQHLLIGDFVQFKKLMFAETGIEIEKVSEASIESEPEHIEHRKTLKVPPKSN